MHGLLAGRYRVLEPLGQGGSASTHRAEDVVEGGEVALKILRSRGPELEQALLRELELLGRLLHPRIAEVRDFGRVTVEGRRRLFYASRLIEGEELGALDDWGPVRVALLDVLEALTFLHAHGVRHGDVTPSNVLVDGAGRGTLIDFGCARAIGTSASEVSGQLTFVAPEVLAGEVSDGRADLFALGRCIETLEARLGPAPTDLGAIGAACRQPVAERPSGAAEVLERLGAAARARAHASPEPSRLLGRDAIVTRFDEALDGLVQGRPGTRAFALSGIAGSGRTRLLRELKRRALGRVEVKQAHPGADAPIDHLLGHASPGIEGAAEALERVRAEGGARVWAIDDIDRLSPLERRRLEALGRALRPDDPVLLLVTGELPGPAVRRETIGPLDDASVRSWAAGSIDPAAVEGLLARAGGHPGTIRRLVGEALATVDGQLPAQVDLSLPMDELSEEAADLVGWLAAAERAWTPGALAAEGVAVENAEALVRRGWLKAEAGKLKLARPADAAGVLTALGDGRARSLHRRLARVTDGPMAIVHALAAGDEAGARARLEVTATSGHDAAWLRAADALVCAPSPELRAAGAAIFESHGLPGRALPILEAIAADEPNETRLVRLAACQLKLERTDAVLATLGALDRTDPRVADLLARAHIKRGEYAEAVALVEPLERIGPTAGLLEESLGVAKTYLGRPDAAAHLRAAERALGAGRPADQVRVASYVGIDAYRRGDLDGARRAYARALDIAERHRLDDRIGHAALNLGTVLHQAGDYDAAARAYGRAHRLAHALGQRATVATIELNEAQLWCDVGAWDRATASEERARGSAEAASAALLLGACATTRAEVALGRGEPAQALRALEDAEARFVEQGAERELSELRCHRVDALRALGRTDEARDVLLALEDEALPRDLEARRALVQGRLALDLGELALAADAFERAAETADALGLRAMGASAHAGLARTWSARDMGSLAERHRREARERWERGAAGLERGLLDAFWAHPDRAIDEPRPPRSGGAREAQLEKLITLHRSLVSTVALDEVLRRGLDAAIELTGAERGFLIVKGARGLEVPVARNLDRERVGRSHLKFSRSIAEQVMETGELVVTVDAAHDDRFRDNKSVHAMKLRSVIAAPIGSPDGALGALYLDNRFLRDRFREVDLDLLRAFADHVGIAIRNARLVEALRERTEELERERARVVARSEGQAERIELLETELAAERTRRHAFGPMIADAPAMQPVLDVLDRVIDSPLTVLVQGESGTGKELVARAVHEQGARKDGPFVSINCAALPDALLESELFGHVRGAFTGADRDREGLMVAAEGGTLFLDEIGETSLPMQAKLLRALEERTVRPVGGSAARAVDFRLVCATNRELEAEVEAGRFREDLFYRVGVVALRLPPLRERLEDLPTLCRSILVRASEELDRPLARLTSSAVRRLLAEPWPGNIRQLQNVLRRAAVLTETDVIDVEHLTLADASRGGPAQSRAERDSREKARILEALTTTDWNVTAAASRAGISRATIYRKMRKYRIGLR